MGSTRNRRTVQPVHPFLPAQRMVLKHPREAALHAPPLTPPPSNDRRDMFRNTLPSPLADNDVATAVPTELIPLSYLALDLPVPPQGWADFLGRRAIAFVPDDLGRDCVRRQDARRLLDEQRANELRTAKRRKLAEAEAVEADQRRRAQIWGGLPADLIPVGVSPAQAMFAAEKEARPRRESPLQHALSNEGGYCVSPHPAEG